MAARKKKAVKKATKDKGGRPTLLMEPEIRKRLLNTIRLGNYERVAAEAAGINPRTLSLWKEKGNADLLSGADTTYSRFVQDLTRARAEGEVGMVGQLRRAGAGYTDTWKEMVKNPEYHPERNPDAPKLIEVTKTRRVPADPRVTMFVLERTRETWRRSDRLQLSDDGTREPMTEDELERLRKTLNRHAGKRPRKDKRGFLSRLLADEDE